MIFATIALLIAAQAQGAAGPDSYPLGIASPNGAKAVVSRLFNSSVTKSSADYDKIAKGMVIMLAPDFGFPLDLPKFKEAFASCTVPVVVSVRPFPKVPKAQAVRVAMKCTGKEHPKVIDAVADIMADDQHTFAILPGGVESVWPKKAAK